MLLFGSKQVPLIGRSLGRGMREFKQTVGLVDPREDVRQAMKAPEDEARIASDREPRDSEPS